MGEKKEEEVVREGDDVVLEEEETEITDEKEDNTVGDGETAEDIELEKEGDVVLRLKLKNEVVNTLVEL